MRNVLKLYGLKTDSLSNEVVENRLTAEVDRDPKRFLTIILDKKFDLKLLVEECLQYNILRKNRTAVYYGEDSLGHDIEAAISFLEHGKNQSILVTLKGQLEAKKEK